ncbi:rab-GTPase-TBC domain-containing protein [Dendryphion nanum]|uniref:Rab-GTPase-TBC domain-containing protein n=1 Tax=Dendryphion nanum TaxID=256645 RepID=A0A9P9EEQ9_9PLEO|nr:rab-GTPase-TBC domain-containing protein [Dendryphion nanum]
MEAQKETTVQETVQRSPRTHVDSQPLPTDSMVTVPLSETGTDGGAAEEEEEEEEKEEDDTEAEAETGATPLQNPEITLEERRLSSRPNSAEIMQAFGSGGGVRSSDSSVDSPSLNSPTISLPEDENPEIATTSDRGRSDSSGSDRSAHVDWAELEKKEEQEMEGEGQDEAMALLLSRLEQENNAISADPKSAIRPALKGSRARSQSRPPSMNQLKRLVQDQDPAQVRFSQLPSPPPMTELQFWAALVRDYPQTVQRLPTLTLNKIRGGIPAPLRGVVWQSAAGARDKLIEDQYDTLCGESSPYENIINKDLGRSFPGVEMFKDPEGEGQKMMGRVLKCFSLYDNKIGYCQGLGFLVGPLLMQMGDKEAFCVLVRLMEDYDLRSCFLPDLSGLHLRIYQFQRLLSQHMPQLAAHLETLGVESAYLSQWFLSFFAVTCPLPMLFRIYDVLFAEGASETIMRVALALMKRNEQKILGLSEFEDVMQLLLGRALWDPYGRNAKSADELVNDFVSFTNDVTKESLQNLEAAFREQKKDGASKEVQKSATSFLGRLWPISNSSTKSVSLSPGLSAPSRPMSFLRRTPSKQSLASTLNSENLGSDSSTATQSTALTDLSRGSSGDALSLKTGHESVAFSIRSGHSAKDRDLHYQIEQLLMSVSQLQRQNSELESALQKQREDRREDHRIVRTVVDKIRRKHTTLSAPTSRQSRRRTTITAATLTPPSADDPPAELVPEEVSQVAETLDSRFPVQQLHHRASSMFETKAVLKDSLARTREQLSSETIRATSLARELNDAQTELSISRDALKETRHRLQESYNQNQRHEKTIQELRQNARKGSVHTSDTPDPSPHLSRSNTADSAVSTTGGLRELRLGRSGSTKSNHHVPPPFTKRSSSLATQQILATENNAPADNDALLLELVNAKTAEAVAKQELEELRNKFDSLRKAMGAPTPPATMKEREPEPIRPAATAPSGGGGWGWGGWKRTVSTNNATVS